MNIPEDPSNFRATPCTIRMDFAKSRRAANLWGGPYPAWMVVNIWLFSLWLFNITMENGPFIDGLPIKNGDFPWLC